MMLLDTARRTPGFDSMGMDHHHHHHHHSHSHLLAQQPQPASSPHYRHKRKASSPPENNERLSKRLSLLNLEHNGSKLYVPVENPVAQHASPASRPAAPDPSPMMQLDDTKHKVYIYNLDDELSSDSDSDDAGAKLLFLPDIEAHLRAHRVPRPLPLRPVSETEGRELVLYTDPASLSVPEEHDGVRRAIMDFRARLREKQRAEMEEQRGATLSASASSGAAASARMAPADAFAAMPFPQAPASLAAAAQEDPDAMELD